MGTKVNLDYQVDNTQFDVKVKDQIKEPGGGVSRLEVVNVGGDEMTGELKLPTLTLNSVNSADVAQIFGSQAGAKSTLHIRYGKNADDEFQVEFYNGSTASAVLHIDGNKDMTATVRDLTVNSSRDIDLTADSDINLNSIASCIITTTACTIISSAINLIQGNNKIDVSGKWRFTNDGTNYYYIQEGLPVGTTTMYKGTGIADVATRTEDIGARGGDTVKLTGWKVCNGLSGTPNLKDKFIRGETASGNTGGSDDEVVTHNHTSEGPSNNTSSGPSDNTTGTVSAWHKHQFTGGGHEHNYTTTEGVQTQGNRSWHAATIERKWATTTGGGAHTTHKYANCTNPNANHSHTMANHTHTMGSHTHTINNTGTSGGNKPAYYSLIFITKMS